MQQYTQDNYKNRNKTTINNKHKTTTKIHIRQLTTIHKRQLTTIQQDALTYNTHKNKGHQGKKELYTVPSDFPHT